MIFIMINNNKFDDLIIYFLITRKRKFLYALRKTRSVYTNYETHQNKDI